MQQSLVPDSSALVVMLEDQWVQDVQRDSDQAHARAVIANEIATATIDVERGGRRLVVMVRRRDTSEEKDAC